MCDDFFLELVEADVCSFLEKISSPSVEVLLFPPLLSRYRFCIHKIVEDSFPDLQTVSVGREDNRRTAVYFGRRDLDVEMSAEIPSSSSSSQKSAPEKNSDSKNSNRLEKKNVKPSLQPYIPPPQRNRSGATSPRPEKNVASNERFSKTSSRKKDGKLGKGNENKTTPVRPSSSDTELAWEVSTTGNDFVRNVPVDSQGPCQKQLHEISGHLTEIYADGIQNQSPPRNGRSLEKPTSCQNELSEVSAPAPQIQAVEAQNNDPPKKVGNLEESEEKTRQLKPSPTPAVSEQRSVKRVILHADSEELVDLVVSPPSLIKPLESLVLSPGILKVPNLGISSDSEDSCQSWRRKSPPESPIPTSEVDAKKTEKLQKLNSTEDVGKKTDGDVSQANLDETWTHQSKDPQNSTKKSNKSQISVLKSSVKPEGRSGSSIKSDPNLSANILEELTAAFGENVAVHQVASTSYRNFSPVNFDGSGADNFLHVLEVYDIPSTFSTTDLTREIQTLTRDFIEVRWVDETHALCLCSSETAARKTLSMRSPVGKVKLRPLSEASEQSKKKAKDFAQSDSLGVSKQRPETNAAAARRMVAGALGMKIVVPKEKRDQEREQLSSAKEKKVQVIKKKEEIWEGLD